MKKKDLLNKITACILSATMLFLSVSFLISPKSSFSETENRVLSELPEFNFERLFKGRYTKEIETYFTDHFPFRLFLLSVKTKTERLIGKKEQNGVIFALDGYLMQDYQTHDAEQEESIAYVINRFTNENPLVKVSVMVVPNSVAINYDKLPKHFAGLDQQEIIANLYSKLNDTVNIKLYEALIKRNKTVPAFYRLDHHWTSYAAYTAYVEYAKNTGLPALSEESFNVKTVSDDFSGTMASKAAAFYLEKDSIVRYEPKTAEALNVTYYESADKITKVSDSLYEDSFLTQKDKYSSFLNANQPLTVIKNLDNVDKPKLIIVKDSYANCFVPFLTSHYSEIYVVDLRYFSGNVSELCSQTGCDNVLILYNLINMETDIGILKLK